MKTPTPTKFGGFIGSLSIALATHAFAAPNVSSVQDYLGPQFHAVQQHAPPSVKTATAGASAAETLARWNQIAINASGLDHTPVAAGDPRVFGEQLGPARASRAMAIVHIAMFDSVNAVLGGYKSYTSILPAKNASIAAAIAQAARDTLSALFPSQQAIFDQALSSDLYQISVGAAKSDGVELGHRTAAAILALRSGDGSAQAEQKLGVQFFPSDDAGKWRQDPISKGPIALGALWNQVTPFVAAILDSISRSGPAGDIQPGIRSRILTRSNFSAATALSLPPCAQSIRRKPEFIGLTTARLACARLHVCITKSR